MYAVSIHTAGWHTKNRYVNICIYVDSLRLLAAIPPTAVVVQLGARWAAVLRFLRSGFESRYGDFLYFTSFFVFCNQFSVSFRNIFTYSDKHQGDVIMHRQL